MYVLPAEAASQPALPPQQRVPTTPGRAAPSEQPAEQPLPPVSPFASPASMHYQQPLPPAASPASSSQPTPGTMLYHHKSELMLCTLGMGEAGESENVTGCCNALQWRCSESFTVGSHFSSLFHIANAGLLAAQATHVNRAAESSQPSTADVTCQNHTCPVCPQNSNLASCHSLSHEQR